MTLREAVLTHAIQCENFSTRRKLRHLLNRWSRLGGAESVEEITPDHLDQVRAAGLKNQLSTTTIESTISDLLSACRMAGISVEYGGRKLKKKAPSARQPSLAEFGKAYASADAATWPGINQRAGEWMGSPGDFWRTFFALAYATAARLEDLLDMTWSDNIRDDFITWVAHKTGKVHMIPYGHVIRRILNSARQESGSDRVLCCAKGARKHMRDSLRTICAEAGVPTITAKQLRCLSITQWGCTGGDCGMIVHGQSLGMRSHYYGQLTILREFLPRFRIPDDMLTDEELASRAVPLAELTDACARLSPEKIRDLARMAAALG